MTLLPHRILSGAGLLTLALLPIGPVPAQAVGIEPAPGDRRITLMTGDTVRISADRKTVVPEPGPGRKVAFSIHRAGDRVSVIPSDVLAKVGSGKLDANLFAVTGGSRMLRLPGERSADTVELTISHRGRDGAAAGDYLDFLVDRDSDAWYFLPTEPGGVTKVQVPKGRYLLDSTIAGGASAPSTSALVYPALDLTGNRTVVLDARRAQPVEVGVSDPDADEVMANVFYGLDRQNLDWVSGIGESPDAEPVFTAQVGRSVPELTSEATAQFARQNADGTFDNTPYVYALSESRRGEYYTGFRKTFSRTGLARVLPTYVGSPGGIVSTLPLSAVPGVGGGRSRTYQFSGLPATPVFYVSSGTPWMFDVAISDGPDGDSIGLRDQSRVYKAGETYRQRWGRAVLASGAVAVSRTGDNLQLILPHTDADGHFGIGAVGASTLTVIRDDQKLDVLSYPFKGMEAYPVPAGPAKYKLELATTRAGSAGLSTQITSAWTFDSTTTTSTTPLSLPTIRFLPAVDGHNVLRTGATHELPLVVDAPITGVPQLETSTDDGKSWRPAPVRADGNNRYIATVGTPDGATSVSLRSRLIDASGNEFDTTVIRAYRLED